MARLIIQLRCDPDTGKKDVVIRLESDADALPHEHEQQHQALVQRLFESGVLKPEELGQLVVEREQPAGTSAPTAESAPTERQQAQNQA